MLLKAVVLPIPVVAVPPNLRNVPVLVTVRVPLPPLSVKSASFWISHKPAFSIETELLEEKVTFAVIVAVDPVGFSKIRPPVSVTALVPIVSPPLVFVRPVPVIVPPVKLVVPVTVSCPEPPRVPEPLRKNDPSICDAVDRLMLPAESVSELTPMTVSEFTVSVPEEWVTLNPLMQTSSDESGSRSRSQLVAVCQSPVPAELSKLIVPGHPAESGALGERFDSETKLTKTSPPENAGCTDVADGDSSECATPTATACARGVTTTPDARWSSVLPMRVEFRIAPSAGSSCVMKAARFPATRARSASAPGKPGEHVEPTIHGAPEPSTATPVASSSHVPPSCLA